MARLAIGEQVCAVDVLNRLKDFAGISDTKAIGASNDMRRQISGIRRFKCALTVLPPFPVTA
jgi:hypothetical protein